MGVFSEQWKLREKTKFASISCVKSHANPIRHKPTQQVLSYTSNCKMIQSPSAASTDKWATTQWYLGSNQRRKAPGKKLSTHRLEQKLSFLAVVILAQKQPRLWETWPADVPKRCASGQFKEMHGSRKRLDAGGSGWHFLLCVMGESSSFLGVLLPAAESPSFPLWFPERFLQCRGAQPYTTAVPGWPSTCPLLRLSPEAGWCVPPCRSMVHQGRTVSGRTKPGCLALQGEDK